MMLRSLLFHPDKEIIETPEDYSIPYENLFLETEDGIKIHAWFLKAENSKGTLLYCHGNAGNISGRVHKAAGWVQRGYSVFLLDYRQYGQSEGEIKSELDLVTDADTGLKWLQENTGLTLENTIFYGESLGSWPATQMASKYKGKCLVLEAPFTSFVDLAPVHYNIPKVIATGLLRGFEFSNEKSIGNVQSPVFIIHGTDDPTCPHDHSAVLIEKIPHAKHRHTVDKGAHNDLPEVAGEDFWDKPVEFVEGL